MSTISLIPRVYLTSRAGDSSVLIDASSSDEGETSNESNDESIFEGRRSKRSKSESRHSSPGTFILMMNRNGCD